eukprot:scaffold9116_cov148-Skeletonema_menzelii.AAC.12
MSSNAASTKTAPVHPALLSTFGPGRGSGSAEFSAWAYLTRPRPAQQNNNDDGDNNDGVGDAKLPNLVTAHANSLRIYTVLPNAGTLALTAVYDNLAGTICSLDVIAYGTGSGRIDGTQDDDDPFEISEGESSSFDGLLLGFAGHPRLSLVYPSAPMVGAVDGSSGVGTGGVLLGSSIVDLTPVLNEFSMGGTSYVEQDIIVSVNTASTSAKVIDPTVSVVLGGGIAIASFSLPKGPRPTETSSKITNASSTWWRVASEPHVLPLASLASKVRVDFGDANKVSSTSAGVNTRGGRGQSGTAVGTGPSLGHGFGDILDVTFLSGFTESTLLLLHTNPKKGGGRPWAGRLGRTAEVPLSNGGDDEEAEGDGAIPDTVATGTKYGLSLTAISLSVHQKRSVVLWSLLDALPADAWKLVPHPTDGILVWGVNCIVYASSLGKIKCALAVNGFAKIGCPNGLLPPSSKSSTSVHLEPNPSPLPKLSLQLEGAQVEFVTKSIALVCLGNGSLHSLQFHHTDERSSPTVMSLSPLSHRVGGLGVASCLSILASSCHKNNVKNYLHSRESVVKEEDGNIMTDSEIQARGLLFIGSRMGDCTLLAFSINKPTLLIASNVDEKKESAMLEGGKRKLERNNSSSESNKRSRDGDKAGGENKNKMAEIDILQQEEEDLYRDSDESDKIAASSSIVSNEDSDFGDIETSAVRRSIRSLSVCRSILALDSLTGLGPLGPGCYGPVATCPALTENDNESLVLGTDPGTSIFNSAFSSAARHYIMPCGFGASGGLAVLTTPGRDNVGSSILGESDLCNMEGTVFGLPRSNLVLLGKAEDTGAIVLRGVVNEGAEEFEEVEYDDKSDDMDVDNSDCLLTSAGVLGKTKLLAASEVSFGSDSVFSVFFVKYPSPNGTPYSIVVMSGVHDSDLKSGINLQVVFLHRISEVPGSVQNGEIISITPMVPDEKTKSSVSIGCVWSSGHACVYCISLNQESANGAEKEKLFQVSEWTLVGETPEKIATPRDDKEEDFYGSDNIVAMDLFSLSHHVFETQSVLSSDKTMPPTCAARSSLPDPLPSFLPDRLSMHGTWCAAHDHSQDQILVAICRRSGMLEIYDLLDIKRSPNDVSPIWQSRGCSHGASVLAHCNQDIAVRLPETHKVEAAEIRIFVTGPSLSLGGENDADKDAWMLRSLCILVNTSLGDLHLYSGCKRSSNLNLEFTRIPLGNVSRPSEEAGRHLTKLRRKRIASERLSTMFRTNRLHRFCAISGEDGLFAATERPLWFVSERGTPTVVSHKSRHVAPAGGRPVPVSGFSAAMPTRFQNASCGFLTLHERIGRIGSQRLTLYSGLYDVFSPHGVLPGGGICVQKVPLGVTVRHIEFIDDASVSTSNRPIYVMLISREIEADQSYLNDDGLSPEERQRIKDEKEAARIKKQVEADLGGFDIEQEWVEEIEREDCFEVDRNLGFAPPIPQRKYEVWLVDASSQFSVLDKYELDDFEHGTALKSLFLTNVVEDSDETPEKSLFVSVGTSFIDQDGEDLASKGRVLLFQVKKPKKTGVDRRQAPLHLNLKSEKEITVGPVTSLSSLKSEDTYRVVVGAGAEVTVEQWGSGKLTQVGFYHAHMQVQEIVLFKTFFLLSDA